MVLLALHEATPQRNSGYVLPAILILFADKRQFADDDATASAILCPAIASRQISLFRQAFAAEFGDGEVRHVRPFLDGVKSFRV